MYLTEEQQLRIKELSLAYAKSVCDHYEVPTEADLIRNAEAVEKFIREGIRE